MDSEKVIFDAAIGGGNKINGYFYPSSAEEIKGVIQICHGMAETILRYEEMIGVLNAKGWHVCGIDMLGHGLTYELNKDNDMPKGYFGDGKFSIIKTLADIMQMHNEARKRFGGDLKYVLYGHSMGSFVARGIYSTPEFNREFDAYLFASTAGPNNAVSFARTLSSMKGKKKEGKFISALAFGGYNKKVKNKRTVYDWISTDDKEVDKYIADPMCGFGFTNKGFYDMFTLMEFIQSDRAFDNLAPRPVMFTYGEDDPVGSYGDGVRKIIKRMEDKGINVKSKSYGPYRHEIQHEPVRSEYFDDIDNFFTEAISS